MQYRTERCENDVVWNTCVCLNQAGFFAWRNNSMGVWDADKNTYRRPDTFAISGVSDVMAMRDGHTYFIECKYGSGSLRKSQQLFKKQCEKHGITYLVVYSVKEVEEWIKTFER